MATTQDDHERPLLVQCFQEPYQCIRERMLQAFDLESLFVLACTSKTLRREINRVWDINARLGPYFENPIAFRDELGRRNAIITGAFAVQFFERAVWGEPNMEIMVRQGRDAEGMRRFLQQEAGYVLATIFPERPFAAEENHDWEQFPHCVAYSRATGGGMTVKVRLIETKCFSMGGLHLSCLLNCITSTHAYSLFPSTTFLNHHMLRLRDPAYSRESRYDYWQGRGWRYPEPGDIVGHPDFLFHLEASENSEHRGGRIVSRLRQVGDRYTWTIPLDTQGLAPPRDPPVWQGRTYDFGRVQFRSIGKTLGGE
ncbi:hypothetical protein LQW54_007982 [Pestalotiopsis sp. IQ-011]